MPGAALYLTPRFFQAEHRSEFDGECPEFAVLVVFPGAATQCALRPQRPEFSGCGSNSSAVLVQVNGWQQSFQLSMKASVAARRSLTG